MLHVESPPVEPNARHTSIDGFFRSLAADQDGNAVCIILSGTGTESAPADRQRATLLEVTRYIHKPSGLDDFLQQVGQGVKELLREREEKQMRNSSDTKKEKCPLTEGTYDGKQHPLLPALLIHHSASRMHHFHEG